MFKKCKKGSVCHKAFLRQGAALKNMFPCRKNPGYKTDARVYARASVLYPGFLRTKTVFQGSALPQELLWQTLPFLLFYR